MQPKNARHCSAVKAEEFIEGQPVSFTALDGSTAIAQFSGSVHAAQDDGVLDIWGSRRISRPYTEGRAREYLANLQIIFAR